MHQDFVKCTDGWIGSPKYSFSQCYNGLIVYQHIATPVLRDK